VVANAQSLVPISVPNWGTSIDMQSIGSAIRRRSVLLLLILPAATAARTARAADNEAIYIGISGAYTGADSANSFATRNGAMMAIQEANDRGGIAGRKIVTVELNEATANAGQYDPAQAAANARKFVSDPRIVALIGPDHSGAGKAMAPILSQGDLATVTPDTTNPDITSPKYASEFRPAGRPIYFRTLTTDDYRGPGMARFLTKTLGAKTGYVLDDSGGYGVGLANAFVAGARSAGMNILGRDSLDPKQADYTTAITKIKAIGPQALFYGGDLQAGVKVAKQSYDIIPQTIKGGGGGLYGGGFTEQVGFPAAEGWYVALTSPHLEGETIAAWQARYQRRWGLPPIDYSVTAYDAALVILDAIQRVVASGKPMDRHSIRDAIQVTNLDTVQGNIQFDENGDITDRTVSIFQVKHDSAYPNTDAIHQFKYVGSAPRP
jgi:branched-chain amino acid transport system substrate-binding protein